MRTDGRVNDYSTVRTLFVSRHRPFLVKVMLIQRRAKGLRRLCANNWPDYYYSATVKFTQQKSRLSSLYDFLQPFKKDINALMLNQTSLRRAIWTKSQQASWIIIILDAYIDLFPYLFEAGVEPINRSGLAASQNWTDKKNNANQATQNLLHLDIFWV